MGVFESAIFWIIIAAASEIIALTPLKSNSVVQLILNAIESIKPTKKNWETTNAWAIGTNYNSISNWYRRDV